MTDERAQMQANRAAGLRARHETRLAHAQGCTCAYPDDVDPAAPVGCPIHSEPITDEVRHCGMGRPSGYHPRHKFMLGRKVYQCEGTAPALPAETREARAVRRQVAEEIAAAIETFLEDPHPPDGDCETCALTHQLASVARRIGAEETPS